MTTASATSPQAPTKRPRRARRRKAKVMTEQTTQTVTTPSTRVRPDVDLISRDAYIEDIKKRWSIHEYEFAEAMDDLKKLGKWSQLTFTKLVDRIKSVELN